MGFSLLYKRLQRRPVQSMRDQTTIANCEGGSCARPLQQGYHNLAVT